MSEEQPGPPGAASSPPPASGVPPSVLGTQLLARPGLEGSQGGSDVTKHKYPGEAGPGTGGRTARNRF